MGHMCLLYAGDLDYIFSTSCFPEHQDGSNPELFGEQNQPTKQSTNRKHKGKLLLISSSGVFPHIWEVIYFLQSFIIGDCKLIQVRPWASEGHAYGVFATLQGC